MLILLTSNYTNFTIFLWLSIDEIRNKNVSVGKLLFYIIYDLNFGIQYIIYLLFYVYITRVQDYAPKVN